MKIIHWDHNEEHKNLQLIGDTRMLAGAMRNRETNTPTGVWIRWKYFLQSQEGMVYINSICEDSYSSLPVSNDELMVLIGNSFSNFKHVLFERLDIIDADFPNLSFSFEPASLEVLINELHQ